MQPQAQQCPSGQESAWLNEWWTDWTRAKAFLATAEEGSLSAAGRLLGMTVLCLPTVIQKMRQCYPGISIEILASNELSNPGRPEADIAIRNVQPSEYPHRVIVE